MRASVALTVSIATLAILAGPPLTARQAPATLPEAASPAPTTPAQDPGGVALPQAPVFTTETNLVVLHVNVFDGRRMVPQLTRDAFRVYENGVEQSIELFGTTEVPIAAGLVIDNSSSMLTRRRMVLAGVKAFAGAAHDHDELFTVVFNEHVRRGLPEGVGFTRSRDQLLAALTVRPPGGMTALHDAVIDGLSHLATASNQKRVLVVLSDGKDNASSLTESNMFYRASQSSALIYTIWTGDLAANRGDPGMLERLARGSGGQAYRPESEQDVIEAFGEVARTLRRGYTIGYTPTNHASDGTYRQVKVEVQHEGRRLTARTRQGYTAPDDAIPAQSTASLP